MYRTPGPHFSMAGAMHHWHSGQPPRPYLLVGLALACGARAGLGARAGQGGGVVLGDRRHGSRHRPRLLDHPLPAIDD